MSIADIAKTTARVNWLIGARGDNFNATVGSDDFDQEEIRRALIETESEIAQDLADSRHPLSGEISSWSSDLTNGEEVPAHLGEVEAVRIKAYSGGSYAIGESTTRENIRLWRENYQNAFDDIAHDQSGSGLAGFFNLTGDILTFTGYRAQCKIFTFTPDYSTPAHQINNIFEPVLIVGAIPKLLKIGVPLGLANHYSGVYSGMRSLIRQGHLQLPGIADLQKVE